MSAVVSSSGGKDSCLALYRAQKSQTVTAMLSALDEKGDKARSHGISKGLLLAQGQSLSLKNYFIESSWVDYEHNFISALTAIKQDPIDSVIFGDIDLLPHRQWEEMVCAKAGLVATLPLWGEDRLKLVEEFLGLGFKARVVCVDGEFLDQSFVGREFDHDYIAALPSGVDPCGENGEFHTFVYDGPNFSSAVCWQSIGIKTYLSPVEYGNKTYYFDLLVEQAIVA